MDKKTIMDNFVRIGHEKAGFNGTWLFAENGEIVSKGAYGYRDPENTLPNNEDTIFQLASISKQFAATAVMLMVREGKLSLDDEITKYFPEIPYPGVTIRHLLSHTGGVPDYFGDADWFINIWKEENRVPGNDEIPRFLCETKLKPLFAPGDGLEYSNTGYNLLALVVDKLADVPYEDFLMQNIFEPAGMTSTRCCHIRRDGVYFDGVKLDVKSIEFGHYRCYPYELPNPRLIINFERGTIDGYIEKDLTPSLRETVLNLLEKYHVYMWSQNEYHLKSNAYDPDDLEGYDWYLEIVFKGDVIWHIFGYNDYPDTYVLLAREIIDITGMDLLEMNTIDDDNLKLFEKYGNAKLD